MSKQLYLDKHICVRLNEEFYFQVSDAAHRLRTTRAQLFREAMERYLEDLSKAESLAA